MKRKIAAAAGIVVVASLSLAACSGSGSSSTTSDPNKKVTLTLSGWSLSTTPEFQTLADGFHKEHPNVTIQLKEYDATNYPTLMTADLAAGTAPDIITQKQVTNLTTFAAGGQLMDVGDVTLPKGIDGAASYKYNGTQYAVPYRQDTWVLFYNKDLFTKAGVDAPDGSWTWDDYVAAAKELKTGLASSGSKALPAYQHTWQSTVQGLATAQSPDATILKGDFGYMKDYYDRVIGMQDDGLQLSFNTATANKTTYQAEFGKQDAAMMLMGSWYIATLISQQASGDADKFSWGIAPAPQYDSSTAGTDKTPVTFGDPTGFVINAKIDSAKTAAAKEFLAYAASEDAAKSLAKIGITPALINDAVIDTFFGVDGAPSDDLSKFAWSTHKVHPENPTSDKTPATQTILGNMHTAVMSGSTTVDKGISDAEAQFKNQVG
jgi:multiple sugar transport system substrate-binding protein